MCGATPSPCHLKPSADLPDPWRAAELARLLQRGADHCAAGRAPAEGRRRSRAGADDLGPDPLVLEGWQALYSTINARAEGIQTAASYREPFKTRRCIVPASGYFEWTGPKNDRQPHYFTRTDGQPMALAGLWDRWQSKDKSETKETFTIVTTEPSKFAAQFHNRMPLVLEPDTWDLWMRVSQRPRLR